LKVQQIMAQKVTNLCKEGTMKITKRTLKTIATLKEI